MYMEEIWHSLVMESVSQHVLTNSLQSCKLSWSKEGEKEEGSKLSECHAVYYNSKKNERNNKKNHPSYGRSRWQDRQFKSALLNP